MAVSIALAGKPNSGKSTFFKAATLANVEIANYPFTTIDANHGVAYVRTTCPCRELKLNCGNCRDGVRFVPVEMIDVAGLVPDAHKGRGLGNAFLDNLRQAKAIIHVIDASGGTDIEGNPVPLGSHEPLGDIEFLGHEITMWIFGILKRNWERLSRKVQAEGLKLEETIAAQLEGAGITESHVKTALTRLKLPRDKPHMWTDEQIIELSDMLRTESKPLIIAANKIDVASQENIERLVKIGAIPVSAAAEVVLRLADKSEAIHYIPGDADFVESASLSALLPEPLRHRGSPTQTWHSRKHRALYPHKAWGAPSARLEACPLLAPASGGRWPHPCRGSLPPRRAAARSKARFLRDCDASRRALRRRR